MSSLLVISSQQQRKSTDKSCIFHLLVHRYRVASTVPFPSPLDPLAVGFFSIFSFMIIPHHSPFSTPSVPSPPCTRRSRHAPPVLSFPFALSSRRALNEKRGEKGGSARIHCQEQATPKNIFVEGRLRRSSGHYFWAIRNRRVLAASFPNAFSKK